ncbi:patched domain-containing protein 3-like [Amphiura filiformis]|uniref:patched domain-containing protein 3-like n=1 Tax=Amphiura filiformis TaxID=82378 RepID=UPI003B2126AD
MNKVGSTTTSIMTSDKAKYKDKKPEEDSKGGCLVSCSSVVANVLETAFCKFGRLVGSYPWVTILIALLIGICCSAGMIKFRQESRTEYLWVPVGAQVLNHQDFVEEHFPSERRFGIYTVEADNVLTSQTLQKMATLHDEVLGITVDDDDWNTLCYKLGPNCFVSSLLELWSFNTTIINSLSDEDILDKINEANLISPVFFSPIDLEARLGEITRDGSNRITGAKATLMTYFIKDQKVFDKASGNYVDLIGKAWEGQFIELADEHSTSGFTLYKFTQSSFQEESGESIDGDLTLLAAGYFLIIIYVIIAMSKLTMIEHKVGTGHTYTPHPHPPPPTPPPPLDGDLTLLAAGYFLIIIYVIIAMSKLTMIEHKVYLSLAGILTVGLSIISAMGLASAFGQAYGPVHSVLPFLLLGIGVDDMFVLVAAWYNLSEEEKKLDVTEQVAQSLKHSNW